MKSGEIAIACHEFTAVLHCKCRVVGIGNKFAASLRFNAKVGKNSPAGCAVGERARDLIEFFQEFKTEKAIAALGKRLSTEPVREPTPAAWQLRLESVLRHRFAKQRCTQP